MSKVISVIYCFPRSGGTVLSQCLLSHPENILLSEVNPAESVISPAKQATEWFKLTLPNGLDGSYLGTINAIETSATAARRKLCIRDWTGINFLNGISPWVGLPSRHLEQRAYLKHAGYDLREAVLLRRSAEVYHSLRANIAELRSITVAEFCEVYRAYLAAVTGVPTFHLEAFVQDQKGVLKQIASALDLNFPGEFAERFHTITTVTGNNTLPTSPDSASWKAIRSPEFSKSKLTSTDAAKFAQLDVIGGYTSK